MFIYKTTNLINGKIYIGKYKGIYKQYLGSGKLIKIAIKKYGKENFSREILEDNITDDEMLCEREIFWIKFYDSTNKDIGYNISLGGGGGDITRRKGKNLEEIYGKEKSEEIKRKISETTKGRPAPQSRIDGSIEYKRTHPVSEETKAKMSRSRMGILLSKETKEKMSKSKKGCPRPQQSEFMKKNNPMQGRKHSEETREKISNNAKTRKRKP